MNSQQLVRVRHVLAVLYSVTALGSSSVRKLLQEPAGTGQVESSLDDLRAESSIESNTCGLGDSVGTYGDEHCIYEQDAVCVSITVGLLAPR